MKTLEHRTAAVLRRRIEQFYRHLNGGDFDWCYNAIDPYIRRKPTSVTLFQYVCSLKRFLDWSGGIRIRQIDNIQLHLDETNRLYENRDFALVHVDWEDQYGEEHSFNEKWVRDRRGRWYTRGTGFVVPETA